MYTISYQECKKFLMPRFPLTPNIPEVINLPTYENPDDGPLLDRGRVREKVCCTYHRYFEWDLEQEYFAFSQYQDVDSPVFFIDEQSFYLKLSPKHRYTLKLYRAGPSVKDTIYSWRSNVISYQDVDQDHTYLGKVDVSEDRPTEWSEGQLLFTVSSSYLHNFCLRPDRKVTFFLRFNIIPRNFEEKVPIVSGPCNHGTTQTTPTTVGSLIEKEWEMYKKVQWDIPSQSIKDCLGNSGPSELMSLDELLIRKTVYKSPVFQISDQTFYLTLEISRDSSTPHYMRLYRCGPSVDMTVKWWIQVKNGSSCIFNSKHMDLTRACVGWTYDGRLVSVEELSGSSTTVVEFLMSKVDTICGVIKSPSDGESPLELDPSRTEFLTFRVQGHDFTIHRSLLVMRVPVFEAMLSHNNLESQTGILTLDDCDPVVIGMFLHYVDAGDGPLWGHKYRELTICLTGGLCIVADKYLVPELRDMCLALLDEISMSEDLTYSMSVAVQVDRLAHVIATLPPEKLEKWPMVKFFHTYEDENEN